MSCIYFLALERCVVLVMRFTFQVLRRPDVFRRHITVAECPPQSTTGSIAYRYLHPSLFLAFAAIVKTHIFETHASASSGKQESVSTGPVSICALQHRLSLTASIQMLWRRPLKYKAVPSLYYHGASAWHKFSRGISNGLLSPFILQ